MKTRTGECRYGMPLHGFMPAEMESLAAANNCKVTAVYGKQVFWNFFALQYANLTGEQQREEYKRQLSDLQVWLNRPGYGCSGSHLHVILEKL